MCPKVVTADEIFSLIGQMLETSEVEPDIFGGNHGNDKRHLPRSTRPEDRRSNLPAFAAPAAGRRLIGRQKYGGGAYSAAVVFAGPTR